MIKIFSTFSGIGGFELGIYNSLGKENVNIVGYSEVDKYCQYIYDYNFPSHKNFGDIKKINIKNIPDFDILVGGFPCQTFSISGKREGLENEEKGNLFFYLSNILKEKQPSYFVFENVKGLTNHNKGNTFKKILKILNENGYNVKYKILNTADYGIPQNRERIYIIGKNKNLGEFNFEFPKKEKLNLSLSNFLLKDIKPEFYINYDLIESKSNGKGKCKLLGHIKNIHQSNRVYDPNYSACTLQATGGGIGGKTSIYLVDGKLRKLIPEEAEQLQNFPIGWTKFGLKDFNVIEITSSQRLKQCGNAVSTNIIEKIFSELKLL